MFFSDPGRSQGKAPMAVESQSNTMADKFGKYVENARWTKNGVLFATVHAVGSGNSFGSSDWRGRIRFQRDL